MVDIIRRPSEAPVPSVPSTLNDWDPFAPMRQLLRWSTAGFDPFREMLPVFEATRATPAAYMPAFEVKETKEGYLFKADIPGVKEEDLKINVAGTRLTITGKRDEETKTEDETYYCYERNYGSFSRVFTLPDAADVDHIKADLKSGLLSIVVPKRAELLPKEITVKVNEKKH